MLDWFDGQTPCPRCKHTCFDHCVCVDEEGNELIDPPCACSHDCHFEVIAS